MFLTLMSRNLRWWYIAPSRECPCINAFFPAWLTLRVRKKEKGKENIAREKRERKGQKNIQSRRYVRFYKALLEEELCKQWPPTYLDKVQCSNSILCFICDIVKVVVISSIIGGESTLIVMLACI